MTFEPNSSSAGLIECNLAAALVDYCENPDVLESIARRLWPNLEVHHGHTHIRLFPEGKHGSTSFYIDTDSFNATPKNPAVDCPALDLLDPFKQPLNDRIVGTAILSSGPEGELLHVLCVSPTRKTVIINCLRVRRHFEGSAPPPPNVWEYQVDQPGIMRVAPSLHICDEGRRTTFHNSPLWLVPYHEAERGMGEAVLRILHPWLPEEPGE